MTQKLPFNTYEEYIKYVEESWNDQDATSLVEKKLLIEDYDSDHGLIYRELTLQEFELLIKQKIK